MKILTNGNYVDFEAPIQMDESQFKEFCNFMSNLLEKDIQIRNVIEKHKIMKEIKRNIKNWDTKELFLLLSPMSNEELEKELQRSDMSITMMRGHFVPAFMSWARKKGYDSSKITETVVKQYLEEEKNDNS